MAPMWWIIIIVVCLIFGMPVLMELRDIIVEGLGTFDDVPPGTLSVLLLAFVVISVIGIVKAANGR